MALDKTFSSGEILSAGDVNGHLLSVWIPIDKRVVTSGSPVTSVSFVSLDTNFRLFRLSLHVIQTNGLLARLNNDSGSNYAWHYLYGNSSTPFSSSGTPAISIDLGTIVGNTAGSITGEMTIAKAVTTVPARFTTHIAGGTFATPLTGVMGGLWNNTSSLINRIDVIANGGSFYGIVAIEGMRGV